MKKVDYETYDQFIMARCAEGVELIRNYSDGEFTWWCYTSTFTPGGIELYLAKSKHDEIEGSEYFINSEYI